MHTLIVGKTKIRYTIRLSQRAKRRRIIVTPGKVEVVAPTHAQTRDIQAFIYERRRWVYTKREEVEERFQKLFRIFPERLVSGAKIPYRGRQMCLRVIISNCEQAQMNYRNGFFVTLPKTIPSEDQGSVIHTVLSKWLKEKTKQDVGSFINDHSKKLDLKPKGFRIKNQKHIWGSCGKDNIININWHLIFAPKPVLEYVVVHELCHLRYRNHSKDFWMLVKNQLPDYEIRKKWLDKHEYALKLS